MPHPSSLFTNCMSCSVPLHLFIQTQNTISFSARAYLFNDTLCHSPHKAVFALSLICSYYTLCYTQVSVHLKDLFKTIKNTSNWYSNCVMWCCDTLIDSLSVKGPVHLDLSVLIPLQRPDVLIVSHLCVMDGMLSKCGQQAWTTGNCVTMCHTVQAWKISRDFAELQTNSQALNHI